MKKLARVEAPQPHFLIYTESPDGVFETQKCPIAPLQLRVVEEFTNWTYTLNETQLVDATFAEPVQ